RLGTHTRKCADARARLQSGRVSEIFTAYEYCCRTVDNAGGISRGVNVVDRLHLRVAQQSNGVVCQVPQTREGGFQGGERFQACAGPQKLVAIQYCPTDDISHGRNAPIKMAGRLRFGGAALALDGVAIDIRAAEAVKGRDEIRPDPLRCEISMVARPWVRRPCAGIGADVSTR